jgi:LmbE family N-acetylglucosaminyl deacetylase
MHTHFADVEIRSDSSTIIFAPHPDDETLGCGGVACKLLAAGAQVKFVFVTDGAASHRDHMDGWTLQELRETEAIEAVRRLGGAPQDVTFLRFPDGRAHQHVDAIAAAICPLLTATKPDTVFVTHAEEPPSDHIAANLAVRAALDAVGRPVTVYEYPIWYWYHWPWVRMTGDLPRQWRLTVRQTLRTAAGLRSTSAFNSQIYVGDVLEVKRRALAAHASQTERRSGNPVWPVLADLSGGEFVERLLTDYETFRRYEVNA